MSVSVLRHSSGQASGGYRIDRPSMVRSSPALRATNGTGIQGLLHWVRCLIYIMVGYIYGRRGGGHPLHAGGARQGRDPTVPLVGVQEAGKGDILNYPFFWSGCVSCPRFTRPCFYLARGLAGDNRQMILPEGITQFADTADYFLISGKSEANWTSTSCWSRRSSWRNLAAVLGDNTAAIS